LIYHLFHGDEYQRRRDACHPAHFGPVGDNNFARFGGKNNIVASAVWLPANFAMPVLSVDGWFASAWAEVGVLPSTHQKNTKPRQDGIQVAELKRTPIYQDDSLRVVPRGPEGWRG
jgi:hypothetical protein